MQKIKPKQKGIIYVNAKQFVLATLSLVTLFMFAFVFRAIIFDAASEIVAVLRAPIAR